MRTHSSRPHTNNLEPPSIYNPQTSSHILNFPIEVLHTIFSYLPNPLTQEPWPKFNALLPSERLVLQSILVVRQVCHQFRAVADDLSFWYDDNFEPVSLISNFKGSSRVRESPFLNSLLTDIQLVNNLGGKKKNWRFHSFSAFSIFFEAIPMFRENVTGLAFVVGSRGQQVNITGYSLEKLTNALRLCSQLQSLHLQHLGDLHLDQISDVAPALTVLRISGGRPNSLVDGTLDHFSNLHELVLDNVEWTSRPSKIDLPAWSAKTLKVLEIRGVEKPYTIESLSQFSSLSSLYISPCDQKACNMIIASKSTLKRFGVGISYSDKISLSIIIAMISAPSLKTLEVFSFNLEDHRYLEQWTENDYRNFVEAISSNTKLLHTIHLSMPFRKTSFQHFASLISLRSVSWEGRLMDVEDTEEAAFSEDIARAAIEGAFAGFEKRPECRIVVIGKKRYYSARTMQVVRRSTGLRG